jgi:hypothetical protein
MAATNLIKRRASIAAGTALLLALFLRLCIFSGNARSIGFVCAVSAVFGWLFFRFLRRNDLNQVAVKFPAGEVEIGRTAENLIVGDWRSVLWYANRGSIPYFYSAIITNRRISLYDHTHLYRDIWLKDLKSISWTQSSTLGMEYRLDMRYMENGSEKLMTVTAWASLDLFIDLMSKAGVTIPPRPQVAVT